MRSCFRANALHFPRMHVYFLVSVCEHVYSCIKVLCLCACVRQSVWVRCYWRRKWRNRCEVYVIFSHVLIDWYNEEKHSCTHTQRDTQTRERARPFLTHAYTHALVRLISPPPWSRCCLFAVVSAFFFCQGYVCSICMIMYELDLNLCTCVCVRVRVLVWIGSGNEPCKWSDVNGSSMMSDIRHARKNGNSVRARNENGKRVHERK